MAPPPEKRPEYSIPSADLVRRVIAEVLNEAMTIRSQTRFHDLVMEKLKSMSDGTVKLSERRLRKLALGIEGVEIIIHCREGNRRPHRTVCPVCGSRMEDIKNSTLYGWTVSTGRMCPLCHYWTGARERVPVRYVFTVEKERYLGDRKEND